MARARKFKRREKPPVRVRVLDGVEVYPVLYHGRVNEQNFKLMAGTCGKGGEIVKNSVGEPVPFKSIGELVWK
tara:strand:- start:12 stop:230 length:219 start_codon:yes stop_codon:yes gene_type:complete